MPRRGGGVEHARAEIGLAGALETVRAHHRPVRGCRALGAGTPQAEPRAKAQGAACRDALMPVYLPKGGQLPTRQLPPETRIASLVDGGWHRHLAVALRA
jgi:hypothetical protein